jgi:hypothetical protein
MPGNRSHYPPASLRHAEDGQNLADQTFIQWKSKCACVTSPQSQAIENALLGNVTIQIQCHGQRE